MSESGLFEKNMKRLEEIISRLETPDLTLEEGIALYKEGAQCSKFCREELEKAKHELEIWQLDNLSGPDASGDKPDEF